MRAGKSSCAPASKNANSAPPTVPCFAGQSAATRHFTRVAAVGVDTMVGELAERRGLTLEHAEQWLAHVGLAAPVDSPG